MSAFVIAEIGPNHNGSLDTALRMVDKLTRSGADAIKFQLAEPEAVYSADAFKADYQSRNDGTGSVIHMSRRLQLPREAHQRLQAECVTAGVTYLCTAFDIGSLQFLDETLDVPRFKIASGELLTVDMLEYMSRREKPVILSTGMATFEEVSEALAVLTAHGLEDITLLHCVSNYPAPHADMNLRVIPELAKRFRLKTGFSDHSLGPDCCLAAVALGATVIEKHVTLDKSMPGPDHQASATIDEFTALVGAIRNVEAALGSPDKQFSVAEESIRRMARKSIVTRHLIPAGSIIGPDDITYKRPGTGLSPMRREKVIGRRALRDLLADRVILNEDISSD